MAMGNNYDLWKEAEKVESSNGTGGTELGKDAPATEISEELSELRAETMAQEIVSMENPQNRGDERDSGEIVESEQGDKPKEDVEKQEKTSLELLQNMEQMLQYYENSSDPHVSKIVEEYKNLKKSMKSELNSDAKKALEQAGIHLDTHDDNRSIDTNNDNNPVDWTKEFEPPKDALASSEILGNPETRQQREDVKTVVDNRSSLNPEQQRLLDEALNTFKNDIENVYAKFSKLDNKEGN